MERRIGADGLPGWRETPEKQAVLDFVHAVTAPDSPDFVAEPDRIAVFDNDGTLWTERPVYAQLAFALDRAAELGHPASPDQLRAGGLGALVELVKLTHAGVSTDEFAAVCRRWLASARHPRFGRPYPAMVYQPMLELLDLLAASGFSCWIFSGGGTDFMRAFASEVYGLPPHRVIGSVGTTEFRDGPDGPELIKSDAIQVINDGQRHGPDSRRRRREQVDRDRHGGRLVRRLPAASLAAGATRRYPTWAPRPAQYGARSWRLSTLPEPVRGSSAAKSTERGTL